MYYRVCNTCGVSYRTRYEWSTNCYPCYSARKRLIELAPEMIELAEELTAKLPSLIQFCHPDKNHGREELSNSITRWLLETRAFATDLLRRAREVD